MDIPQKERWSVMAVRVWKSSGSGVDLKIRGLRKEFGNRQVLSGIDLEIQPGEFVAVIGRSGCGKSTLLRLIAGLEEPTAGELLLRNVPVRKPSPEVRIMFQDPRLLPWKRVVDNVALGLGKGEKDKAKTALRQVGLHDRAHEWPSVLSGGQKQRVALARALVNRPRLLLLDEPLGALDALTRIEMQRLIESLWLEQGFTAVLVTHDVEEAVALADRVVLLEQGRVAMDVPVPFSRPRQRGHGAFAALVDQVLRRVLGEAGRAWEETDGPAMTEAAEGMTPVYALRRS